MEFPNTTDMISDSLDKKAMDLLWVEGSQLLQELERKALPLFDVPRFELIIEECMVDMVELLLKTVRITKSAS